MDPHSGFSRMDPDPGGKNLQKKPVFRIRIRVFSPIRIRVLKVRIRSRPFINLWDLNDGYEKVLEEPDQNGQCVKSAPYEIQHFKKT